MRSTPTRLNILITAPFAAQDRTDYQVKSGVSIRVRHSWSEVEDDMLPFPEAPVARGFPAAGERWDAAAINTTGRVGAYVNVYPVEQMRAFVAELRAVWGDLHVQDNSGMLPDLDQGKFQ